MLYLSSSLAQQLARQHHRYMSTPMLCMSGSVMYHPGHASIPHLVQAGHIRNVSPKTPSGDVQDQSQDLEQLSRDIRHQMQTLAPSLLQLSVTLRTDVLPSLRGTTATSKRALLVLSLHFRHACSDQDYVQLFSRYKRAYTCCRQSSQLLLSVAATSQKSHYR